MEPLSLLLWEPEFLLNHILSRLNLVHKMTARIYIT